MGTLYITSFCLIENTDMANKSSLKQSVNLDWYRRGGIDKSSSRQPPSCTRVSQKSDGSESGGEHAGTDWWEHSGWTPSDLLGLA